MPGSFSAASTSTAPTPPPIIGQWRIAANSRPGGRTSMPNCAVPLILATTSSRGAALPIRVHSLAGLSWTVPLGVEAAAFASSP